MNDELRSMNKSAFAQLGCAKSAGAVSSAVLSAVLSVVLSVVAASAKSEAASAQVEAGWPKKAEMKSEKSEKWFFAIFHLEPAAVQSLPTKIGVGHFSDFSKNSRGYTGGDQ
jgi:hypothetical protein